ncbi:hypothetical protein HOA92_02855 [archaeon]|nr:hypothetical protein [archaeon]MBT6761955.1 hypothetical protein [archaeon]
MNNEKRNVAIGLIAVLVLGFFLFGGSSDVAEEDAALAGQAIAKSMERGLVKQAFEKDMAAGPDAKSSRITEIDDGFVLELETRNQDYNWLEVDFDRETGVGSFDDPLIGMTWGYVTTAIQDSEDIIDDELCDFFLAEGQIYETDRELSSGVLMWINVCVEQGRAKPSGIPFPSHGSTEEWFDLQTQEDLDRLNIDNQCGDGGGSYGGAEPGQEYSVSGANGDCVYACDNPDAGGICMDEAMTAYRGCMELTVSLNELCLSVVDSTPDLEIADCIRYNDQNRNYCDSQLEQNQEECEAGAASCDE